MQNSVKGKQLLLVERWRNKKRVRSQTIASEPVSVYPNPLRRR